MAKEKKSKADKKIGVFFRFSKLSIAAVDIEAAKSCKAKGTVVEECIDHHLIQRRNGKLKVT